MKVPIPSDRASVSDEPEGLQVVIPATRQPIAGLFLAFWLCGWLLGEVFVIRQLLSPSTPAQPRLFLIVWLAGWTVGGGFALFTLLWMLIGRERVLLRPDALVIRRELGGLARTREYELGGVSHLRVSPDGAGPWEGRSAFRAFGVGRGTIAFDYGSRTFRFGEGIEEAEARTIIARLRARHRFPGSSEAD